VTAETDDELGYTLVEMIVVLLLVGFIATAISSGLQMGTRVWERSESGISSEQSDEAVQAVLRALLVSAVPRKEDGRVRFHGEPNFLAFDAAPPAAFGMRGMERIEISISRDGDASRLSLKISSLFDARSPREAELALHKGRLHFSYLDTSERVPVWLDYWRNLPHMPDAVRLDSKDRTSIDAWPPLVVHLPLSQDARCQFDPVTTECR
jgi:prepilin-type N-terminal cleavage/methylation domain-containing protein